MGLRKTAICSGAAGARTGACRRL